MKFPQRRSYQADRCDLSASDKTWHVMGSRLLVHQLLTECLLHAMHSSKKCKYITGTQPTAFIVHWNLYFSRVGQK